MILCTGSEGFIGKNLVNYLRSKGEEVIGLDIKVNDEVWMPVQFIHKYGGRTPKTIFHLAAQSRVQPSFEHPVRDFEDNVKGTLAVLEYARKNGCKVVYAGSSSKHQDTSTSPYSCYKFLGEELCKLYRKSYGVDVDIARFYNVYGPGEALDPKYGNVIGIWRYNLENNQPINIVGDGYQRRDFIHVHDICDGLWKIGNAVSPHEDAWELGTGKNYAIIDLATVFYEMHGATINFIPDQQGNYRETLNTNTDAFDRLGWSAKHDVIKYLEQLNF